LIGAGPPARRLGSGRSTLKSIHWIDLTGSAGRVSPSRGPMTAAHYAVASAVYRPLAAPLLRARFAPGV